MRLVNISYVKEGSVLARSIRNSNGKILLGEGIVLSGKFLTKRRYLGFDMLFIRDDRSHIFVISPIFYLVNENYLLYYFTIKW